MIDDFCDNCKSIANEKIRTISADESSSVIFEIPDEDYYTFLLDGKMIYDSL